METELFKQQQHDRIEEGKELQREDEMRDLSQIPAKELPGNTGLLSKISQGFSNVASTISEKVGLREPVVEGHEELDQSVKKQVKKVNAEILKHSNEPAKPVVEKHSEWEKTLPKHVNQETEETAKPVHKTSLIGKVREGVHGLTESISQGVNNLKEQINPSVVEGHEELDKSVRRQVKKVNEEIRDNAVQRGIDVNKTDEWETALPKHAKKETEQPTQQKTTTTTTSAIPADKTSIAGRVREGVHGLSENLTHGVDNIKQRFVHEKEEERDDDGTKHFKTVKDGIKENINDLKHEQRIAELGQEELSSKNPFQPLNTGNEGENQTIGEKVSQKISGTVGGVTQKVKSVFVHKEATVEDKENAQQVV